MQAQAATIVPTVTVVQAEQTPVVAVVVALRTQATETAIRAATATEPMVVLEL
jgi:hypothetical protein